MEQTPLQFQGERWITKCEYLFERIFFLLQEFLPYCIEYNKSESFFYIQDV